MSNAMLALAYSFALLAFSSLVSTEIVNYSFKVQNTGIKRLCAKQVITAVNGQFPGPTLHVREGDTVVVRVVNRSPYNVTIHWHGIFQKLSCWADGPNMITQCPIRPGNRYTYRFRIVKQEGTLWWHAHLSWLRATVHGAMIIRPKLGARYPFPVPFKEVPILLGEWWNANVLAVQNQAMATGGAPNLSNAYTINGLPGNLYPCSENQMYQLEVAHGKTYLLRVINTALNNQLFFKIASHQLEVVAIDASYTLPRVVDVITIAPGQTVDVLLRACQPVRSYYMAATPYSSAPGLPFDNTTTRGILTYKGSDMSSTPIMPLMPENNNTSVAHEFYSKLLCLPSGPHWVPVPLVVDERMFVTLSINLAACETNKTCLGPNGQRLSASMNNFSFQSPTALSLLQAFFFNISGVYNTNFPDKPSLEFDYTNANVTNNPSLLFAPKSTSVKKLKYNSTVEMVLQNTALISVENHPMHIHGFNFHVLAQGFGNYNPARDPKKFNLFNPQMRNTIAVPVGGWAVIRFIANNPGVWFMHCHLDVHLPWGLATAFIVENGPRSDSRLPPPPRDLPQC